MRSESTGPHSDDPLPDMSAQEETPRVLVIDDEASIVLYLIDLLETMNYETCAPAASGASGLKIAEEERPTLALVDIGLQGGMDGIETAAALWQRFGIPSIFLSGTVDGAVLARARAINPRGFVRKPFMPHDLEQALINAQREA